MVFRNSSHEKKELATNGNWGNWENWISGSKKCKWTVILPTRINSKWIEDLNP